MKKFLKILLGIILLPLAFNILLSVFEVALYMLKNFGVTLYFIAGAVIYVILHFFVYDFSRPYVVAHEFSHAVAALLCGYKVSGFKLGSDSGSVKVSNINTFVLLAPYGIPFYSIAVTLLYFVLKTFWPQFAEYSAVFAGLLGFFTVMHCIHTYKALTETEQSDISKAGGGIYSFPLIVLANMVFILLLAKFYFPDVIPVWAVCGGILRRTFIFWKWFFTKVYLLCESLYLYAVNK